ncbi:protein regulator of cytokinesis 1 isoform X1 [Oncorhynchus kisutch]|uniref:protein regulator of cytokinesis 1 isoform X1 n=1 Tax=Oncorhynchus kisutch TaxID=8019 RepID=UPI0009A06843|nr:protein regulator of cytokinesis 1 isoform X1 [Oncorhynchus kisutch]XP_020313621.1 protein regulator of cytokinesis 1 isoform X1 [Oncorhynchus kisutch]
MSSRRSEALAFSLVTGINHAMARLVDIWDSMGIMEEQRVERMETVKKHIEGLLNDMITEEEALRHRIRANIITFQKQLDTLCLEMSMDPYKMEEGLTVLQIEKNLRLRVEVLTKEKGERLKELHRLQQQDKELCVELCVTPYYIPTGSMPSRTQLQELREHIQTLSEEKKSRAKVFSGLREDIRKLMEEMGHEPETSLEKESVGHDEDIFLLTHENIKALKLLLSQMEVKKESLTNTLAELKERSMCLWNRLDALEQNCSVFQESVQGTLSDQITQWQREVDRLTDLQKTRLGDVIEKVRQELVTFWDKCNLGREQREPFNAHLCDNNFTEELLALHDAALLKVKNYYDQVKPLLEALQRWEKYWALFQDFEKKANDPNRFSNRGGALLKEAKEKVKVQKMLPKLEEELKKGVEAWEKDQGSAFLVQGRRVMTYISSQWEEYKQQRDKEKSERAALQTSKKGEMTTPFKTPTKRAHGGINGPTPNKIRKPFFQKTPSQVTRVRSANTFISVPSSKPPLSQVQMQKIRPLESSSIQRTPLLECNSTERKQPVDISYLDFTSALSKKSSDAVFNSTAKDPAF